MSTIFSIFILTIFTIAVTLTSCYLVFMFYINIFFEYTNIYNIHQEYDYIIIGAGSAGSVVASRLAKNSNNRILILEAGTKPGPFFNIPFLGLLFQQSVFDWNYATEAQQNACLGLKNNQSKWPMGRIVGGSGMLNNMVYARGHKHDFHIWYKNKENYNYETDVLWYFKKSENQIGSTFKNEYHAKNGPLTVQDLLYASTLSEHILNGVQELGYPVRDLNSEYQTGFMRPRVNQHNGRKYSTGHNLLELLPNNPNLHLLTNSLVTKILFKNKFEANGIQFTYFNQEYKIFARKEIILCAGVIGTPKVLMLSGIGPEDHLNDLGITVKNNLPVGDNLMDHISTGVDLIVINTTLSISVQSLLSPFSIWDYFYSNNGPWTTPGCEVLGCIKLAHKKYPELGFMVIPLGVLADSGIKLRHLFGLSDNIWENYFSLINQTTVSILPILLHPESKGTVRLRDSNPNSKPLIDPNYLSSKNDVKILIDGIRFIQRLIKTKSLKHLNAEIVSKHLPGCKHLKFDTDLYWECYIRHITLTSYHPGGTCKMGDVDDSSAVVGYDFKVHRTNNLRVVDASVLPYLPSANINAAIVMLAEKLVDEVNYNDHLKKGHCDIKTTFLSRD